MQRRKGFTLIELLVVISIIALLIGILLPALGSARRNARQMQSSTQVRGIIQGCINFAPNNKEFYPGVDGKGSIDTTPLPTTLNGSAVYHTTVGANDGSHPAYRYAVMMGNSLFTPEYAISPSETKNLTAAGLDAGVTAGDVYKHYSYCMLMINNGQTEYRIQEWKSTTNSKAVVMSDRNLNTAALPKSIHDEQGSVWRGTVGYNDNHVNFETSEKIANTSYAGNGEVKADSLFVEDQTTTGTAISNSDAAMVFQDNSALESHKFGP